MNKLVTCKRIIKEETGTIKLYNISQIIGGWELFKLKTLLLLKILFRYRNGFFLRKEIAIFIYWSSILFFIALKSSKISIKLWEIKNSPVESIIAWGSFGIVIEFLYCFLIADKWGGCRCIIRIIRRMWGWRWKEHLVMPYNGIWRRVHH